MIYVVQQWQQNPGVWVNVLRDDHMPLMFTVQAKGWKALAELQARNRPTKYRLVIVREGIATANP